MNPRVKAVRARQEFVLELHFDNDEVRIFDMQPYLAVGVFQELRDAQKFAEVQTSLGSIAWPSGQDLCPDTLYRKSTPMLVGAGRIAPKVAT